MTQQAAGGAGALLEVRDLVKRFPVKGGLLGRAKGFVSAVDGVSFDVLAGETLGVVGESGCGKSTLARLVMGLTQPDSGSVRLLGEGGGETSGLTRKAFHARVQMVFQDSYASLNPRLTVEQSIAYGPRVHGVDAMAAVRRARRILERVGLEPKRYAGRYPHELSGGQRQRVNIARALALEPKVLILDESVSALDKSVEAQVLNLLLDLKEEIGLTYVFISHDLDVVRFMSSRVLVMYLGRVAEIGAADTLFEDAQHPYTRALFRSMLSMDPDQRTLEAPISGDPPSPIDPPPGCRFNTRCAFAEAPCRAAIPHRAVVGPGHEAACHMSDPASGHSRAGVRAAAGATP